MAAKYPVETETDGGVTILEGNIPTPDQKYALAGSTGTPGTSNKYVTEEDPKLALITFPEEVTTHDATPLVVANIPIPNNTVRLIEVHVAGQKTNFSEAAGYVLRAMWRNTGTVLTQLGGDQIDFIAEDDGSWGGVSTSDHGDQTIDIKVAGKAATDIDWTVQTFVTPPVA